MVYRIRTTINNERGFTLIEIMASIVILSLFVVVLTQFMGISVTDVFHKGEQTTALTLAQDKMEEILSKAEDAGATIDLYNSNALKGISGYVASKDDLLTNASNPPTTRFCMQSSSNAQSQGTVQGTLFTVVVFYHNGQYHVEQTSFIAKIPASS